MIENKIVKDVLVFIGLSLFSVALYMVLRAKTDVPNKQLVTIISLLIGILIYVFKTYRVKIGSVIYAIVIWFTLAPLIDIYPSVVYIFPYGFLLLFSFLFHRFINRAKVEDDSEVES